MLFLLLCYLILAIPLVAIIVFILNLCQYISIRSSYKQDPDSVLPNALKNRKTAMIISGITAIVVPCVLFGIVVLLSRSISFM